MSDELRKAARLKTNQVKDLEAKLKAAEALLWKKEQQLKILETKAQRILEIIHAALARLEPRQ
jgi:hypothetical protein